MGKKRRDIPKYDVGLIETHCHLDYLKDKPLEEILEMSKEYNVEKIITIAVSPSNLESVRTLASSHDFVYGTQGVHPHEAKDVTQSVLDEISSNLKHEKIVAVGEIGLDYYYNNSPKEDQLKAFEAQLQIACEEDMPVVVHTRDADEDTKAILKNFSSDLKSKGVIHSFTSSIELAEFCLSEGFYLGFNGIITFKSAQNVRDVLAITPIEKILIETDAPFLTPTPYRGRENAPFYLPFILEKVAEEKGLKPNQVSEITKKNALSLFF